VKLNLNWRLVKTIIALPGTVLVFVPAFILIIADNSKFSHGLLAPDQILFWLALLPAGCGFALAIWTVRLFMKFGDGTPAPWDPPKKLVIRGPYRHVRNPMITAVLFMLLSEAILFQSWPIAMWMGVFFIGNAIYFPLSEEKGLDERFGDEYRMYKAHVPRWIPRLRPWNQQNDQA
jgi:protein-S-isoprenylcysteine O-methyltransferase Ste14